MRKTNSQLQTLVVFTNAIRVLLLSCLFLPSIGLAQTIYPFASTDELSDFTTFNVNASDLQNGHLLLQDTEAGDTQVIADDDSGILSTSSYSGGLEVILQYSDNTVPNSGYSARPALFLSNDNYVWEAPAPYPYIAAKTHSSIDSSWFDFSDNDGQNAQATVSPRNNKTYLRLVRQQDEVSAWYWHSDAWQQVGNETLPYEGDVQVGVRMFANYQDLYSVKLEQLTLNIDQDSDGLIDDIETLLGTNPEIADTDGDGKPDGIDLWPTDETQLELTRVKNRGSINTQLIRVGNRWSMLVKNLSPQNVTPSIVLSGLAVSTEVTDPDSGNSFSSVEDGFTDTEMLPAFATRLYQFPATAYTAPDPTKAIYPSTSTAWVIPGFQQTPTDPTTLSTLPSVEAVKDWEVSHADISFGGGFGELNTEMKATVGYMYNQSLGFNPGQREMSLRNRADQNGLDYEDFMLHFSEDTVVDVKNAEHSTSTPFYGVPTIMGYTRTATDSGVPLLGNSSLDTGVWDNSANDGALYVYLFEPFDRLKIDLSTVASGGELLVEYPSAVDANGVASQWQSLNISDGTNNLSQNGTVSWAPPSDWKRTATYNADSESGHYFANTMLVNGGAYNVVRLKWESSSSTSASAIPRLDGVSLKRWLQPVDVDSTNYTIPGWDAANDSNSDGYIDDSEFSSRSNTSASARFRYEARVVPLGSMWGRSSAFCRPNLANGTLRQYLADYYDQNWSDTNQAGAYNDDFFRQLGEDSFQIISGGQLAEYDGSVQDEAVQATYVEDFKSTLENIKETTGSEWISANISAENLFTESERLPFISSLDAVLREDYLTPSLGLSGYFGVNKAWDNFALAAADIKSVISMHHRNGRASKLANTEANWAKDSESGLALYYLMSLTDKTYFHAWNSTFQYGSDNTFEAPTNFWKAGVPKNYAYQPVDMLEADIGQPEAVIPAGKEAMKYMVKTQVPLSDYTVIGDSTDTVLSHAEIGEAGVVNVIPSNIYYLQRSENNVVADGPAEMVLARNYTKGLVLYRTTFIGGDADFMTTTSGAIELHGTYQRVQTDGTLGEPITSISLQGYEGAILVKVEENEEENIPITIVSSDNLQADASQWGGYEEGSPTWIIEASTDHSPNGKALNCGLTGGDPYSNIHCYRNLPADPDAKYFSMSMDFFMPETTFNNQGSPSIVQALEFTMNQWQDELRYEWALQWMNVGTNGPQWRYWDANKPDTERWVALDIQQDLAINSWHNLRLEGEIKDGKVLYRYFVIDGEKQELNITVDAFSTPGNPDLLAVAVQADGNANQDAYDLLIDNVSFYHTPDRRLDLAPAGSHFRMIGNKLFDPQGNLFIPKGVNIFPWHGSDSIEQIDGCWNFNTVRLHSWILPDTSTDQWKDHIVYVDEPLIFDPDNIGNLRTYDIRGLIESYTSRGIVVLFDVHDLLGKYFEGDQLQDYTTFITDFASKFKDNPYVWIDLQNEPGTYQGAGDADLNITANDFSRWQAQYSTMREAVRAVAPDMPIFASGNAWGQDTGPNWNGNELVVTEESALLSNADFIKADAQLAGTIHVYDQWNYGDDPAGRLSNYIDRVQEATRSPLLIGEYGYKDNTGKATEALYALLQQPKYQHMGRLAWTWSANDDNDLTTDANSHGSGASINACHSQPTNLSRLGELVWQDTHAPELDSDNDGIPNQQDLDDDNDGIPDLWEVEHGLDSTDASDAAADRDTDGQSNLQEYLVSQTPDPVDPIDETDTTAPIVTAPAEQSLASKGFKTRFAITTLQQQGTANDETDGVLDIVLESIDGVVPVYRENKTMVLLRPGRHILTWAATDSAGNKGIATQQLDVMPKASFMVNQSVGEAQTVTVEVVLNGSAPTYPVNIPFTISGSADTQDYQLNPTTQTIVINQPEDNQQPSGSIEVELLEDNVAETRERIIFTMSDDLQNVVAGRKQRHIITIVAQNLAPTARVRVSQNGIKGNRVYQNDGSVLLTAKARDANKDNLTYSWFSQTLVDSMLDNNPATFEVIPLLQTIGWHSVTLQVSDGVHTIEKRKRIKIKIGGSIAFTATQDSDGDGIFDKDETGDENGNGIADYLEDSGLATSQLIIGQDNPMETDPGLSFEIGDAAQGQDQNSGSISEAQLKAWQEAESGSYQADTNHTATLILDYKIHSLEENGSTAIITLNLYEPMTAETAIRKYHSSTGWQSFLVDENNTIESAISLDGNCPTDGSLFYLVGVQTGATCLRLSIQDGGLNDADGIANGTIVDPLAIATPNDSIETGTSTETNTATTDNQSNVESGGGGNMSINMLMLLLMLMGSSLIKRIYS